MKTENLKTYFRACGFIAALDLIESKPEREINDQGLKNLFRNFWKDEYQEDKILDSWYALNIFIAGFKDMESILRMRSEKGNSFLAFLRGKGIID